MENEKTKSKIEDEPELIEILKDLRLAELEDIFDFERILTEPIKDKNSSK